MGLLEDKCARPFTRVQLHEANTAASTLRGCVWLDEATDEDGTRLGISQRGCSVRCAVCARRLQPATCWSGCYPGQFSHPGLSYGDSVCTLGCLGLAFVNSCARS
jgi:hypothetical protein